jgi:tetratricopeptide (TPR) repeat protein
LVLQHHYPEAEKLRRESLEVLRKARGPDDPMTLFTMSGLANTLSVQGRYKEADALLQEAFERQSRLLGPNHPAVAMTKYNLACNAALEGHKQEAITLLKESIEHGLSPLNKARMSDDSDLKSLHGNPEFEALVASVQQAPEVGKKGEAPH